MKKNPWKCSLLSRMFAPLQQMLSTALGVEEKRELRALFLQYLKEKKYQFALRKDEEKTYLFISLPEQELYQQAEESRLTMPLRQEIWQMDRDKDLPGVFVKTDEHEQMEQVGSCSRLFSFPAQNDKSKGHGHVKEVDGVEGMHGQLMLCEADIDASDDDVNTSDDDHLVVKFDALMAIDGELPSAVPSEAPRVVLMVNIYDAFDWALTKEAPGDHQSKELKAAERKAAQKAWKHWQEHKRTVTLGLRHPNWTSGCCFVTA